MTAITNSQTIIDGEHTVIQKFYMFAQDATGETNVVKVDPSTLAKSSSGLSCTGVRLNKVTAITHGQEVLMQWDATSPVPIMFVPPDSQYTQDYSGFGGLPNNSGAGKTGKVTFTTYDTSTGDSYTIILEMIKTYA